jgi:O-antigen/teichoic acid export membrane protein
MAFAESRDPVNPRNPRTPQAYLPVQSASFDRKNSKLSIISLALALGFPGLIILLLLISMILDGRFDFVRQLDTSIALLTLIGCPIVHFTALVLGVVAVFQKGGKNLLSILGIVLNAALLVLAVIIVMFFLSLIAGALGAVR